MSLFSKKEPVKPQPDELTIVLDEAQFRELMDALWSISTNLQELNETYTTYINDQIKDGKNE